MAHKITGKVYWAKIIGQPVQAYNENEKEWTIDVALDDNALDTIKSLGLGWKVKNKGDERGDYYIFQRRELKKKDNTPNQPISVVDAQGKPWDGGLIGNGSLVQVEFNTFLVPAYKKLAAHQKDAILSVTVLEHVPYVKPDKSEGNTAKENWKD